MYSALFPKLASFTNGLLCSKTMRIPSIEIPSRFKSRRSTRLKRDAKKAKRKIQLASLPKSPPKLTFMQKVDKMLMKYGSPPTENNLFATTTNFKQSVAQKTSLSLNWPSRLLKAQNDTTLLEDDVFQLDLFDHTIPIEQALALMRQLNHPMIYDDAKAPVTVRLDLNMSLDLEGKECIENFKDMLVLPHPFEFGKRRVVMAFSKDPNAQMAAREAGAEFVGGEEIIRKIKRGEFKVDEVDYFVSNIDLVQELNAIRGLLKDKLPSHTNGLLGLDVIPLVKHYRNAITIEVKQDELRPDWGVCLANIGRLSMTDEQLIANAAFIVHRLSDQRPLAVSLGHMVHRAALVAPERHTFVSWAFEPFAPPLPNNDAALQAIVDAAGELKTRKKKKKRPVMGVV